MGSRLTTVAVLVLTIAGWFAPAGAAAEPLFADPEPYANGAVFNHGDQAMVAPADFDGDGHVDLASTDLAQGLLRLRFNNGDGTFGVEHTFPAGSSPIALEPCDLDADGRPDIALVGGSTLRVFRNAGGRQFADSGSHPVGQRPRSILCEDYNRDGHADLAVLGNTARATLTVLLGDGQGKLAAQPVLEFGANPLDVPEHLYPAFQQMAGGDLDGDGRTDIVAAGGSRVYVFTGDGDGTFTAAPTVQVDTFALEPIQLADVNADGDLDAVVPLPGENFVEVRLGKGDATFGEPIRSQVNPSAPRPIFELTTAVAGAAADFDGDGTLDLAISGGLDHHVWIMRGDGDGRFRTIERHGLTSAGFFQEARALVSADLDRDGRPDLVGGALGFLPPHVWVLRQR